MKYIPERV